MVNSSISFNYMYLEYHTSVISTYTDICSSLWNARMCWQNNHTCISIHTGISEYIITKLLETLFIKT